MYSKARSAGYPIHPMLVAFPIALYTATVATLLAYVGTQEAFWYRVAMIANVAGIVTSLIAMIPGAIDLRALPKGSRARAAAVSHAGFHLASTALYAVTALLIYRGFRHRELVDGEIRFDATIPLAMSVVAWVSMVIAGSLGLTLVHTHQVGAKPARVPARRPASESELDELAAELAARYALPGPDVPALPTYHAPSQRAPGAPGSPDVSWTGRRPPRTAPSELGARFDR